MSAGWSDAEDAVELFFADVAPLEDTLGPVLVQLPPRLPWSEELRRAAIAIGASYFRLQGSPRSTSRPTASKSSAGLPH